jgi:hypothetical protein
MPPLFLFSNSQPSTLNSQPLPMHLPIQFAAAVSEALTATGLITGGIHPLGGTAAKPSPSLGLTVEAFTSPHPHLHRGTLILRYEFDADATPADTASAILAAATDWLLSDTGRAALQVQLQPSGIWLRRLGPSTGTTPAATGERHRTYDQMLPFTLQTKI